VNLSALHQGSNEIDVLVVGSGVAGLSVAITLAGRRRVAVVSKQHGGGSTALAQGGVAAALGAGDSAVGHARDTLFAAAGLGDAGVALSVAAEAAGAVNFLSRLGVRFDTGAPSREGGHSAPRVVHARGDATGAEISQALMSSAARLGVPVVAGMSLVDLLTEGGRVTGALLWDEDAGALNVVPAGTVVLATGGYGYLWAATTSPPVCAGEGLAAALRAGAQTADLEFVQFHPTGMALGRDPRPLATEALRGAGARLRDATGEYLHDSSGPGYGDLAPRDVVSASMGERMSELAVDHCYLDATSLGREVLLRRFPTFVTACRAAGIDPVREWVPVSPTAHYTMGGVLTDADGRTTLAGLMAVGEVASSGLHGANRLASNSLLEGVVIGRRAAQALLDSAGPSAPRQRVELCDELPGGWAGGRAPAGMGAPPRRGAWGWGPRRGEYSAPAVDDLLRSAVQSGAGVFRDAAGLRCLLERPTTPLVARAVAAAALRREESRGAHRRSDFPHAEPRWRVRQVVELLAGGALAVGELEVPEPDGRPAAVAMHAAAGTS
jgi:L-aspartate oxidase